MELRIVFYAVLLSLVGAVVCRDLPPQLEPTYNGTYYDTITATHGIELERQLSELVASNTSYVSYNGIWTAFGATDMNWSSCPGHIHDIYSTKCWNFGVDQCGTYKTEGDCYNREHSWPKSWWGGESENKNAYTDMHHIFPSDGYVNGRRGNVPFGKVANGSEVYISSNGCKLGKCELPPGGQRLSCFEPADYVKGDMARTYFYMATRYLEEFDCCREYGVNGPDIRQWMERQLRDWSLEDVVSSDEILRNNEVYLVQNNRNPFVDNPQWVPVIRDFGDDVPNSPQLPPHHR